MLLPPEGRDLPYFKKTAVFSTLGPNGTSSQAAAQYCAKFLGPIQVQVQLHSSFEAAAESVRQSNADLFLVAHAYSDISKFYMDPDFELQFVFIYDTPIYGLATLPRQKVVWSEETIIATHPAPVPLLKHLAPSQEFVVKKVRSTSEAAIVIRQGEADIALTNEIAVSEYELKFIAIYGPIKMSWSVFGRKGEAIPHRALAYTTCFAGF